jgi:hypothetical protein
MPSVAGEPQPPGQCGGVRGGDDAGVSGERAAGWVRFLPVDVEAEAAEVAVADCLQGGLVVKEAAAGDVHQQGAGLHRGDGASVDDRRLPGAVAGGDDHGVGGAKDIVQVLAAGDPYPGRGRRRRAGVALDAGHGDAECRQPAGDLRPDGAEPDDRRGSSGQ